MARALAVLLVPDVAIVRWPDGQVERAYDLPAGTLLAVEAIIPVEDGFIAWTHPVDVPEVFALINVHDLAVAGEPVPF